MAAVWAQFAGGASFQKIEVSYGRGCSAFYIGELHGQYTSRRSRRLASEVFDCGTIAEWIVVRIGDTRDASGRDGDNTYFEGKTRGGVVGHCPHLPRNGRDGARHHTWDVEIEVLCEVEIERLSKPDSARFYNIGELFFIQQVICELIEGAGRVGRYGCFLLHSEARC